MEPSIIYEDESIVVLDKPSGLQVVPDSHAERATLESWLHTRYPGSGVVHRIDRDTSGVLVAAKTRLAQEFLKRQFKHREVRKVYRAFVYGAFKDERGTIDKPIGSSRGGKGPRSALKPRGTTRDALTAYHVLGKTKDASYVEVFPKTGRTHQIRVHFSAIQHPVVADPLYAPGRPKLLGFNRLALHALSLTFVHPNGKGVTFEAPLPADFAEAEGMLGNDSKSEL